MRMQLLRSREITAVFPEKTLDRLARNQQGYFFPARIKSRQNGGIPVTVVDIPRGFLRKTGEVTLQARYPADQPDPFAELPLTGGQIRIAVDRITPARLLAKASGLHNDQEKSGPISFAHQTTAP